MARVNEVNKRTAAISTMVEAIIKGNSADAEDALHDYLQILSKKIVLGEAKDEEEMVADEQSDDEDMDDDAESDDDESDDEVCSDCGEEPCVCDSDEESDDEDIKESKGDFPEGAMKRKIVPNTKSKGSAKAKRQGNAAPHLDDKVKGKAKYSRFTKGNTAKKHGNSAPGLKDDVKVNNDDNRDMNLGTQD